MNAITVIDNEPIPSMEKIIAEVGAAKYFTKIDLSKGYCTGKYRYANRITGADLAFFSKGGVWPNDDAEQHRPRAA